MRHLTAPLRLRAYRRLFGAFTVNGLGDWFGEVALAVLVFELTGNAFAVAAVFVAGQFVPAVLAPLLVARVEGRGPGTLGLLFLPQALAFALLAWAAPFAPLMWLYAGIAVAGVFALASRSMIKAASARVTSAAGCLREGCALMNFVFSAQCAAGAGLAGLVVSLAGAQSALALDAASFAACGLLLAVRSGIPSVSAEPEPTFARLRAGFAVLRSDRLVSRLLIGESAAALLFALIIPIEVVFVTSTLGGSEADYGLVLTCWGVGMVCGASAVPLLRSVPLTAQCLGSVVVMGVAYIGMGAAPSVAVVAGWSLLGGIGNGVESFALTTMLQERTPTALLGRVNGLVDSLGQVLPSAGFLIGSALAVLVEPRAAYLVAGAGALAVAAALFAALRPASSACARSSARTGAAGPEPAHAVRENDRFSAKPA